MVTPVCFVLLFYAAPGSAIFDSGPLLHRGLLTPPRLGSSNRLHHPTRRLNAVRSTTNPRDFRREPPSIRLCPLSVRGQEDHARASGKPLKARLLSGAPGVRNSLKGRQRVRPPRSRPPSRGGPRPRKGRTRIPVPRTQARTSRGLGKEPETGHEEGIPAGKFHGHFSVPHIHGVVRREAEDPP